MANPVNKGVGLTDGVKNDWVTMTGAGRGISKVGGYLPLLRLNRAAASKALQFSGLGGRASGHRAVAGWDEDAFTLAAEAARAVLGSAPPARVVFASTSAPFFERCQAALMVDALALPRATRTVDVAGTRRCAISALLEAMSGSSDTLIASGEKRPAKAGSGFHLGFGDGGSSVLVSNNAPLRLIGEASFAHDLIDIYSAREHPTPYAAEERFVKEVTTHSVIAPTISAALQNAGIVASEINQAVIVEPLPGMARTLAEATGVHATNHAADLYARVGDLGAAHPLFALALAASTAKPGDKILLTGFGSGCDALVFVLDAQLAGAAETAAMLQNGQSFGDYVRFLSLTGSLDLDWGIRSEFTQKAQGTVVARHGRDAIGFIGGRDSAGNVQFPKSPIPVRPDADGPEAMEDERLADLVGTLVSVTADRLNFTPDPPFWFGLVQFNNGARVMMELTDADVKGFAVGDRLMMRLRIKTHDKARGFRTYFWKAAPLAHPAMEA